jgi:Domain of unknown function (DUF4034)
MEREGQKVRTLLDERKFEALDAMELRSRDLSVTLSDGQSLRAAYFFGLSCPCSGATREEKFEDATKLRDGFAQWRNANPQSRTAKLGEVFYLVRHAWAFRGEGFAGGVPKADWDAFQEKVEEARSVLDALPAEMKDEPEWYAQRLQVARLLSSDSAAYESLLEEATNRHPRYMPLYFEGAVHYSPLWGGSIPQLKSYIESTATRTKPWLGDVMYARLNWAHFSAYMFEDGQADWSRMKPAFDAMVRDYPDDWNLNNFAFFSCRAADAPTLKPSTSQAPLGASTA